jgi:hypothetical protein
MTKDEALRLALEALEYRGTDSWRKRQPAITAIKAALEAKDEPVATKNNDGVTLHLGWDDLPVGTKLYTTPPQRTWVGLTDEEIRKWWASENGLEDCDMCKIDDFILVARAIEAKLKERTHEQVNVE